MSMYRILLCILLVFGCTSNLNAQKYDSYKGLVMAGYQGWFNAPDDKAERGWYHYSRKGKFEPGATSVDMWADVSEYPVLYKTGFKHKDGSPAYTFSSYDPSTVDTHFRWMKDYGIDGVFMQRFVVEIKKEEGKKHLDTVLASAISSAQKYGRAICLMYDLSGMKSGEENFILKDIDQLEKLYKMKDQDVCPSFLNHNGKPLIAVWGIGFNDGRKYGLKESSKIVDGLKKRGYSVMIGVPTYWRTLDNDTLEDKELHDIVKKSDIIHPWFVGRYDEKKYDTFYPIIKNDIAWCKEHNIDYVPVCYPGFSWKNMSGAKSFYVSRNSGSFLWKQFYTTISLGAEMLYVAMFDEIDEGTAIFKCLNKKDVPLNGKIGFEGIDDHLPTDFYLWLTGEAGRMLRKEIPLRKATPEMSDYSAYFEK